MIAGNHDFLFQHDRERAQELLSNAIYLQDGMVEIKGVKIYGSPWQPRFLDWAFNLDRGTPLREKWDMIPPGVDILVTHGPPRGFLDNSKGCQDLRNRVFEVKPKLHIFGHTHGGYGQLEGLGIKFVNASSMNDSYELVNKPIELELKQATLLLLRVISQPCRHVLVRLREK